MTDYEQWQQWFDKWNIKYEAIDWLEKRGKTITVNDDVYVQFDSNGKFEFITDYN